MFCRLPLIALSAVVLYLSSTHSVLADKNIRIGHLTYHTGEYGSFGPFFDGITDFVVDVINESPPLGRRLTVVHEDAGTVGEWRAIKKVLDKDAVDIVLNASHQYMTYRSTLLKRISFLRKPLLPSVHAGSVSSQYGGNGKEPLFRGSPMDSAQSAAAMLHIKNSGKQSVVLVANEREGHLMQMEAARNAAERLGLTVLKSLVIQPDWTNYNSVVKEVSLVDPDAIALFSPPGTGGTFVRNASEAGHSWFLVGTSEWLEADFLKQASLKAIEKHESVVFSAYSHTEGPAWDTYKALAEASTQIDVIGDVANSYALQYYDLLVASALAIEKSGEINSHSWSDAMYEVTGGDGVIVHSYAQGIKALRAGKDINYDGVTGTMEYTQNGVVAGLFGIFQWTKMNTVEQVAVADGEIVADLDQQ